MRYLQLLYSNSAVCRFYELKRSFLNIGVERDGAQKVHRQKVHQRSSLLYLEHLYCGSVSIFELHFEVTAGKGGQLT